MNFCPSLKHSEDLPFISIGTIETFFIETLSTKLLVIDTATYL